MVHFFDKFILPEFGLFAFGDVYAILGYLRDVAFAIKNRVSVDFNVLRVTIFVVVDVLYCYRFSGLFDNFKRAGAVSPTTRLISFMGNHITGCFFGQLSLPRS